MTYDLSKMTVCEMLRYNEGVRTKVYKDSLGIETIGVGFNLRRAGAREVCEAQGLDFDALLAGRAELKLSQVDGLLQIDVAECKRDLKTLLPQFSSLPSVAQMVLVDMRFQLGGAGLRAFKNTLAAFAAQDWAKASAGMRASKAFKQTPVRWDRNAKAIAALGENYV